MKSVQATLGRVFVLRLEDGDRLPDCIEAFARDNQVEQALVHLLGGMKPGSRMVSGPADPEDRPIRVILQQLAGVHEAAGVGTLFPDEQGHPRLHLHAVFGRDDQTRMGCTRPGIEVWQIAEAVILELSGPRLARRRDPGLGFEMLAID